MAAASAFTSEMVRQKLKTIRSQKLKSTLEDMLLTLSDQIHLIRMVGPASFICLAADRANTNLAIVRVSVARHAGEIS